MSKKLTDIEGVGEKYAAQLKECGITTQEKLLEQGAQKADRKKIAEQSGVSEKLILAWCNKADLARVKGIGEEWADLLEHSGVDTVPELATRNAANLWTKMTEVNESKKLCRSTPSEKQITDWVEQAKKLPRAIHY